MEVEEDLLRAQLPSLLSLRMQNGVSLCLPSPHFGFIFLPSFLKSSFTSPWLSPHLIARATTQKLPIAATLRCVRA